MSIFQKSVISKYSKSINTQDVKTRYEAFKKIFCTYASVANIMQAKEEQYQEGFINDLFVTALGYNGIFPKNGWDIKTEQKNVSDAKKADGAIYKDGEVIGLIELKQWSVQDLKEASSQAFRYKFDHPKSKYVIVSNFGVLRYYVETSDEYEEFSLFNMSYEDFELLYLVLSKESIFSDIPLKMKNDTKLHDEDVSAKLYKDYHHLKMNIFQNMTARNLNVDKVTLLKKSQKLLDRLLFILFAEDRGLLEPNTISRIIDSNKSFNDQGLDMPLYDTYKLYFKHIDKGNDKLGIPAYNGGLFAPDEILDALVIDDFVLKDDALALSKYDYSTDVDVNILGHIFENSLNDIDELHAEVNGEDFDKTKTKRKKDGVFYTPKYITKYIVDNTLGALCEEKKKELGLVDIDLDTDKEYKRLNKEKKDLLENLTAYSKFLLGLKVLDPACGSGAFLNQALEFLIEEHTFVQKYTKPLMSDSSLQFFDIRSSILENNLYGVDINEESVELARLSLWLRTAERGRKLNNLSKNIRVGNSLIDDPAVAGDLAFKWEDKFPEVFAHGGFDVVIGNPPYGAYINNFEKDFYKKKMNFFQGNFEIYSFFIEKTFSLVKIEGKIGFITPDTWINIPQAQKLRVHILNNYQIEVIIAFNYSVFSEASVNAIIFILKKNYDLNNKCKTQIIDSLEDTTKLSNNQYNIVDTDRWKMTDDNQYQIWQSIDTINIIDKILSKSIKAGDLLDISQGIVPYSSEHLTKEEIKQRIYHSDIKIDESYDIWVQGRNIKRYYIDLNNVEYLKYGKWLHRPRSSKYFNSNRILIQEITGGTPPRISAIKYSETLYHDPGIISCINISKIDANYILLIINSQLTSWFHSMNSPKGNRLTFPKVLINDIRNFPIPDISPEAQVPFIEKADLMLTLNKTLHERKEKFLRRVRENYGIDKISGKLEEFYLYDFKVFVDELAKQKVKLSLKQQDEIDDYFNEYKKELLALKEQIDATDREIDRMVYELYGLTEDEVRIVEGNIN